MIKTLALAAATAALVIGSIAVAQTSSNPNMNSSGPPAATTDQNANPGAASAAPSAPSGQSSATSAGQYGSDTSATSQTDTSTSAAGERG